MKIETKHMRIVESRAEDEGDNGIIRGLNEWLRTNAVRLEWQSYIYSDLDEFRALMSAEDADRLLSHVWADGHSHAGEL